MCSPCDPLVVGKVTRSLSFKEQKALAKSLAVVMASKGKIGEQKKKKKQREHANKLFHVFNVVSETGNGNADEG